MEMPQLSSKGDKVSLIRQFGGLNKGYVINDGEWSDSTNMTNDHYPAFTNRSKRCTIASFPTETSEDGNTTITHDILGFVGGKVLSYVVEETTTVTTTDETTGKKTVVSKESHDYLYYDDSKTSVELTDEDCLGQERQLVLMGAYLCIFPDGVIYNTQKYTSETVVNKTTAEANTVTIGMCNYDRTISFDSSNTWISNEAPSDTTKYKYWLDKSQTTAVMKMYSSTTAEWASVSTVYVKFTGTGIGKGFSKYDAVTMSGVDEGYTYNNYDFNTSNVIYYADDNTLQVVGLINGTWTNAGAITFERKLPKLDYVCELNNRLWGCFSGYGEDGNYLNEVYSTKLGDPKNWYFYGGMDSDSYAASVGSQTRFTGIASYGGYAYFFKEDGYHKLYGSKPSNYEMVWKPGRGVQYGSAKSVCMVNEYMFFKSRDAVCYYDGSVVPISSNIDGTNYYDAIAGSYRDKYYVYMRDADYNRKLYVYDMKKQMWMAEDTPQIKFMDHTNDALYMVDIDSNIFCLSAESVYVKIFPQDATTGKTIPGIDEKYQYPCDGENKWYPGNIMGGKEESDYEWSFTTGDIDLGSPYQKYIKRFDVRVWLDTNAKLKIEIMYDSTDEWEQQVEYYSTRKRSYDIPINIQRCDHMQIRFSGWGNIKLFSLAKVTEEGSADSSGEV